MRRVVSPRINAVRILPAVALLLLSACGGGTPTNTNGAPPPYSPPYSPAYSPSSEPPPTTEPPAGLIDHVPSDLASDCVQTGSNITGVTDALECTPADDPQSVLYFQFDSRATMDIEFDFFRLETGLSTGNCRQSFEQYASYSIDGSTVGRYACSAHARPNWNWIWTNTKTHIMGVIIDEFWYPSQFYQWWVRHGATTD